MRNWIRELNMKILRLSLLTVFVVGITACTSQEIAHFTQMLTQPTTTKSSTKSEKTTADTNTKHVIRVQKNPSKGKKRAVVGGMELPSSYSYDEDGELQWTPKTTDRDIREYNRILKGTGIKIEGY